MAPPCGAFDRGILNSTNTSIYKRAGSDQFGGKKKTLDRAKTNFVRLLVWIHLFADLLPISSRKRNHHPTHSGLSALYQCRSPRRFSVCCALLAWLLLPLRHRLSLQLLV